MSRNSIRIIIAFAVASLMAALVPTASVEAAANKRITTVSKVAVATQRQGGFIAVAAGGGSLGSDTALDPGLVKVQLKVSSKKFTTVDQISITYYCAHPSGDADLAVTKSKWIAPEGGVKLPAKVALKLPTDRSSELCYVSAGLSAPWTGERTGKVTLALKTLRAK